MRRAQKHRPIPQRRDSAEVREETDVAEVKARLASEMDALLEEIDGVLEENAEEFVTGFVQKGGE